MKTAVRKFTFPHFSDEADFDMSRSSKIIHAGIQGDDICVWAIEPLDKEHQKESRRFILRGTGEPLPEEGLYEHVASFEILDGDFMFHVFENWGHTLSGIVRDEYLDMLGNGSDG